MEMVMSNGFAELSVNEMIMIDGGWGVSIKIGPVSVSFNGDEVKKAAKKAGKWYMKNVYNPMFDFGASLA